MRVAHIVPSMNVGGVEMAIYRTSSALNKAFDYKVYCVKSQGSLEAGQHKFRDYLKCLLSPASRPDVVLTSLWWSHPIGFISTFFGVQWVVFLHSSGFASFPDWLFCRLAVRVAKNFFYDSENTKRKMLAGIDEGTYFIPCFTLDYESKREFRENPSVDLVWVGRNSPEKRLDLISDIAHRLLSVRPSTRISLYVAGEQFAEFDMLKSNYGDAVYLRYNDSPDAVLEAFQDSRIALCLSDYEGFSMSTAEAAFYGNLIAAREVGDLHLYLPVSDTLWLKNLDEIRLNKFAEEICNLLDDEVVLNARRKKTKEFAKNALKHSAYAPAFVAAIRTVTKAKYE
jgi:glycosyltransferase involved in cell wall biosynthesis